MTDLPDGRSGRRCTTGWACPIFSRADYAGYLRVNRTFASALAKLVCPSDLVWVHDYHLIPLAAELRASASPI